MILLLCTRVWARDNTVCFEDVPAGGEQRAVSRGLPYPLTEPKRVEHQPVEGSSFTHGG